MSYFTSLRPFDPSNLSNFMKIFKMFQNKFNNMTVVKAH